LNLRFAHDFSWNNLRSTCRGTMVVRCTSSFVVRDLRIFKDPAMSLIRNLRDEW
jgi:hypothetical protein